MNKILRLELWKTYLIFLCPILLMTILVNLNIGEEPLHHRYNWQFYSIFGSLCILMIMLWHYLKGISFYGSVQDKSLIFKVNGLIPVLFYTVVFLRSLYEFGLFLNRRELIMAKMDKGIIKVADLGLIATLFQALMIYSFVALFINNNLIEKAINKIGEQQVRQEYMLLYLKPMRSVAKTYLFGFLLLLAGFIIYDTVILFL